jgi:hypothetical protein
MKSKHFNPGYRVFITEKIDRIWEDVEHKNLFIFLMPTIGFM